MSHYHDEGTEADYMYDCQMSDIGAESQMPDPDPDFEVVNGRNDRVFAGSRSECWAYKRKRGGFVRPFSGEDFDAEEWRI